MRYAKRIIAFLVFVCGLIVLLLAASFLFMPKNNMKEFGMEEVSANGILGEKENTVDVLVVGDSESYSAVTPMQIWKEQGYTAYVCGSSGQTLDYSMTMIRRAFEKQKPKLVFLETDAIYRKVSKSGALLTKLGNYLSVFRYHNRWKSLSWNDLKGHAEFTWTDDYKGYTYSSAVAPCKNKEYMIPSDSAEGIPELNRLYVREIRNYCEENGAKLVFLSTPSPVNWNYERHNGIAALAGELSCDYIDLNLQNEQLQIDWSKDTRDKGDHLNHNGAVKATHYLADYLNQTNLLTDHREDSEYEKWNEAFKRYEAAVSPAGSGQ
ncbi:MAG: hypothetical protein LKG40_02540 [Lachnospiraceae bacterium]|jgi:hypothetical protein|nr:hypothetical protein [Lachnospiraceae bacterium]MCI1328318.1 hypothetical protein [Lachnospiraceae bacterium]